MDISLSILVCTSPGNSGDFVQTTSETDKYVTRQWTAEKYPGLTRMPPVLATISGRYERRATIAP